jgi:hypothetical protein
MSELRDLLGVTADLAGDYLETLGERPVLPQVDGEALREALGGPLPNGPADPRIVISQLAANASPGIAGIPAGRWFGFVMGGGVPAALGADWRVAPGAPRHSRDGVVRLRHRLPDGARDGARGGPVPSAERGRLGRRARRPLRRAAHPRRRWSEASRHARPRAAPARHGRARSGRRRRRGRPTRTSGSTSPTTAASRSAPTPSRTARRWASRRPTSCTTRAGTATRWTTTPSSRAARAGSPSTRRSGRWAGPGSRSWSSAAARTRARSRTGSATWAPRC